MFDASLQLAYGFIFVLPLNDVNEFFGLEWCHYLLLVNKTARMHRLSLFSFAFKNSGKAYPLGVFHFQSQLRSSRLRISTRTVTPLITTFILQTTGDTHRVYLLYMSEQQIDHQNKRRLNPFLITNQKRRHAIFHFQIENHLSFS